MRNRLESSTTRKQRIEVAKPVEQAPVSWRFWTRPDVLMTSTALLLATTEANAQSRSLSESIQAPTAESFQLPDSDVTVHVDAVDISRVPGSLSEQQLTKRLERAADFLADFDIHEFTTGLATISGQSPEQIHDHMELTTIHLVTNAWIDRSAQANTASEEMAEHIMGLKSIPGQTIDKTTIVLNIEYISTLFPSDERFDGNLQEIIAHELIHTIFSSQSFDYLAAGDQDVLAQYELVNEGLVQAMALRTLHHLEPERVPEDTAYQNGIRQLGEVLVVNLTPEVVGNAYVHNQAQELVSAFDQVNGVGSWQRAIVDTLSLDNSPLEGVTLLRSYLNVLNDPFNAVATANRYIAHGQILPVHFEYSTEHVDGVFLRNDYSSGKVYLGVAQHNGESYVIDQYASDAEQASYTHLPTIHTKEYTPAGLRILSDAEVTEAVTSAIVK